MTIAQPATGTSMVRVLQPISNGTRRDEVAEAIRQALLTGELQPGQRIKEIELATTLGVSRPTLREAILILIHEGTLIQEPYKGIKVAEVSVGSLLDLAEVRVSLETTAALRLADDPSRTGLGALRIALTEHQAAIERGDSRACDRTHLEFHRTLWLAAENEMLTKMWPLVAAQIRMAMTVDQAARYDPDRDLDMHVRLVDVIETGDADAIRAEIQHHIRSSAEEVAALMTTLEAHNSGVDR